MVFYGVNAAKNPTAKQCHRLSVQSRRVRDWKSPLFVSIIFAYIGADSIALALQSSAQKAAFVHDGIFVTK